MGKKSLKKRTTDTQPQLTRLHGLVQRIQKGDYPSAKILAQEWEKHWSTIIRDLDFIRDMWGLPLEAGERKRAGAETYQQGWKSSGRQEHQAGAKL